MNSITLKSATNQVNTVVNVVPVLRRYKS